MDLRCPVPDQSSRRSVGGVCREASGGTEKLAPPSAPRTRLDPNEALETTVLGDTTRASELAADIERYLNDEPVLAGPPSTTYRASNFVRRHRFGVAVAAAALI